MSGASSQAKQTFQRVVYEIDGGPFSATLYMWWDATHTTKMPLSHNSGAKRVKEKQRQPQHALGKLCTIIQKRLFQ